MLSEDDFQSWCQSLRLSDQAQVLVSRIRSSEPSRCVRSAVGNVSGFYPSRKMKRTIQFESHRNELASILEMEHHRDTIEFYDQPPPNVFHTPGYFIIRQTSAAGVECKWLFGVQLDPVLFGPLCGQFLFVIRLNLPI